MQIAKVSETRTASSIATLAYDVNDVRGMLFVNLTTLRKHYIRQVVEARGWVHTELMRQGEAILKERYPDAKIRMRRINYYQSMRDALDKAYKETFSHNQ